MIERLRAFAWLVFFTLPAWGQDAPGNPGPRQPVPVVPTRGALDVVLGRPSGSSVTLSLLCYEFSGPVQIRYASSDKASMRLLDTACVKDQPKEIWLDGLLPDTAHRYELRQGKDGPLLAAGRFRTARPASGSFSFTLTADSHLDGNTDTALYQRTLANALADMPDFHLDLGDTFMTDKHENRVHASQQYRAQRVYLAGLAGSAPLFLVLGNHDGEESRLRREGAESLAVWANAMRKRYFPNPQPDGFYTGNRQLDNDAGPLQDYYAFEWGSALFVVLDPYWHGTGRRTEASWGLTLGEAQYLWLKETLERSQARFKFVFVHQLVGGMGRQGRGGIEAAGFGEWGGRNADGSEGFSTHRPGWDMPIHPLLVRHGVNVVFHGHDHLFARQSLDGIVYQEVPQPGHPGEGVPRFAAEYGYRQGLIMGGSGHLRVTVTPVRTTLDFIRASLAGAANGEVVNRDVIMAK